MFEHTKITLALLMIFSSGFASADILPVCERTPAVRNFIVNQINTDQKTTKTCDEITDEDLSSLKRVAVPNQNVAAFKVGDFSGLPNLEILNIKGNPFTELPEGLMADLPKLTTLVIFRTKLASVPDDFLANMDNLNELIIFGSPFTSLPENVFARLAALKNPKEFEFNAALIQADKDRLTQLFPQSRGVDLSFR